MDGHHLYRGFHSCSIFQPQGDSESSRSMRLSRSSLRLLMLPLLSIVRAMFGFIVNAVSNVSKSGSFASAANNRTPLRQAPRRDRRMSSPSSSVICNRPCKRTGRELVSVPLGKVYTPVADDRIFASTGVFSIDRVGASKTACNNWLYTSSEESR